MHLNILSDSLMLTRASVGASCLLRKPNKVRSWEKVICLVFKKIKIRIGRAETTTHKTLLPVSRRLRDRQDVAMLLYVDRYQ